MARLKKTQQASYMKKKITNTKTIQIILCLSLVANIVLGFLLYQANNPSPTSTEKKNFNFEADCNTVSDYKVCASDFVGLKEEDAIKRAKKYGLTPVISGRDGKALRAYATIDLEPFRINFSIKDGAVEKAFYH